MVFQCHYKAFIMRGFIFHKLIINIFFPEIRIKDLLDMYLLYKSHSSEILKAFTKNNLNFYGNIFFHFYYTLISIIVIILKKSFYIFS